MPLSLKLVGTTRTVLDPCDCPSQSHSGHIRYLDHYNRRTPRKYRKRGGRPKYQAVLFTFTLNGHTIPKWLGRWLSHRKFVGKRLIDYHIQEIRCVPEP